MTAQTINPQIFRAYDIRGVVDKDLTPEIVEQIVKGYATFLHRRRIVDAVVGGDTRPSTETFKQIVIKTLVSCGINVIDIGTVLSTMVYWAQYWFNANGAVMVTASHNPPQYNGFKMSAGFSKGLVAQEIQEIKKIITQENFISGSATVKQKNITEEYFSDLLKRVTLSRKMKIAVDTDNGTPGLFVKELLKKFGAEVIGFNLKIDGSMPLGTADPTDQNYMHRLSQETVDSKADIGLAFDTDGDRFGIVDEKGQIIWNDVLLAVLAKDVLEHIPGAKIVYNTLCSRVVRETIEKYGGTAVMARTGHSYIEFEMTKERAPFGGELSGHFFFEDNFYGFDDGFYSVLRLLDYFSKQQKSVSEVISQFPLYVSSPEIKLNSDDALKNLVVEDLSSLIRKKYPSGQYSYADGVRVDLPDAMIAIRASDNGPYLTVRFEGKTSEKYSELKSSLHDLLTKDQRIDLAKGVNNQELL